MILKEMEMTRTEVIALSNAISAAQNCGTKLPIKFNYALSVTKRNLKTIVDSCIEAEKTKLETYYSDLAKIGESYADLDEKGKPVLINNKAYRITEKMYDAQKAKEALEVEHADKLKEVKEFKEEKETVSIYTYLIDFDKFPDLEGNILDGLTELIETE